MVSRVTFHSSVLVVVALLCLHPAHSIRSEVDESQMPQSSMIQPGFSLGSAQLSAGSAYSLSQSLGGAHPALQLTSPSLASSAGSDGGDGSGDGGDDIDQSGRPLSIEATPLDESAESSSSEFLSSLSSDAQSALDSSTSGGSSLASALSSLSSGSSLGSLSSSRSGSSGSGSGSGSSLSASLSRLLSGSCGCPPVKPKKKCPPGITPGPCGGGGPLKAAKIVDRLTGGGKKFNPVLIGKGIWTFTDGTYTQDQTKMNAEVDGILQGDVVLQQLQAKLEALKDQMDNEQLWVEDVQKVVAHYKAKAGSVAGALKNQATEIKALKAMVEARKKMAARKALEKKLLRVNAQLQQLQATTSSVSGEAKSLVSVQQALNKSIQGIQSEIERLRSANGK